MVSDTVYVYTNQEAHTDQAYNDYFESSAVSGDTNGAGEGVDSSTAATVPATLVVLNLDETDGTAHPVSTSLPASGSFTVYPDEDDDTADIQASFTGSFRGVSGKFACTASGTNICRAERDAMGKVKFPGGGAWTFTADEPEGDAKVEVMGVLPDPDYMTFGFWLREDTSGDDPTAMVETLYATKVTYPVATAAGLTGDVAGMATYSGAATGKFARKEFTSDGESVVVTGGQFTADADLTAYFGKLTSVAEDNHNRVHGEITNFMSGGSPVDESWSVSLMGSADSGPGMKAVSFDPSDLTDEVFVGNTAGDKGAPAGKWEGTFAGPTMKPAPTEGNPNNMAPIRPGGIVGEFNGNFTNGYVVGAFGATLDESE